MAKLWFLVWVIQSICEGCWWRLVNSWPTTLCNNHDSCYIEIPKWFEKILKLNPGEKSLKAPFPSYLDLECLLKKNKSCQNNSEKSYTEKKAKHEPSSWAIFTKCSFDKTEDKLDYYRGKYCIEKLC